MIKFMPSAVKYFLAVLGVFQTLSQPTVLRIIISVQWKLHMYCAVFGSSTNLNYTNYRT